MSDSSSSRLTLYRYLTGPDDATFCHKVTQALSAGWSLYGSPTITFDPIAGKAVCGQAVTKDVAGLAYDPAMKLAQQ